MATLDELADAGLLVKIDGGLDDAEQPERRLFAYPHVIDWFENVLPGAAADMGDGSQTPIQQLDDLLHLYVSGADLSFFERSHSMQPDDRGVWELKTTDLRLFGWFRRKNASVIAEVDTAYRCKLHGLYGGYRDSVERRRQNLDLDEPKFIIGKYDDVL
ncbi:hypothetical protein RFM41_24575 [Mesorhizobium sp. VK25A]|uniref:Uncharacterized protein n=1 Tax=Mesorhizobium vachelliae TaxID=3072309 RepID=A0ABU5A9B6_9HYPH|nr:MULTISPECIES: hypothetical protein [unclassified Mesorhizobium]MDX8534303.1 hypothetical protein [Mesorhizobium sp. VK25D]MDX8546945.1 hypothetical protein [Mesorhizobium sp. VK25A]